MRKILKKTATLMMTAVIGVSMSCPKMIVYAGQRMQMQERYTTPKEWNYTEITAYQFGSTDKFEDYLQTGGLQKQVRSSIFKCQKKSIKYL